MNNVQFQKAVSELSIDDYYTSPDFQCDQTGGFPVSLCSCCAEFGIRSCHDTEDFNNILRELGEDAYQTAWIPDENEEMRL